MTTLVNSYRYDHFFLGQIPPASVVAVRAADPSGAMENNGAVMIGGVSVPCQDFAYAMNSFNDTEGGASQDVTSLASNVGQRGEGRPTWEAPCTMRVYVSDPEDDADSAQLVRDHSGYWVMYAEHEHLGKIAGVVIFDAFTRPFGEDGQLIATFTLQNAGRYLPKWVA